MAKLTRKELKSDRFALEVGHTVEYVGEHRKQIVRFGAAALVLALLVMVIYWYRGRQHTARQQELAQAVQIQETPVGPPSPNATLSFATQEDKNKEAIKAFTNVLNKYPSSEESMVARYYLGSIYADQGKLADAEKSLKTVADSGSRDYSSLAKLSLAHIYFSQGKKVEGERLLRDLLQKPTIFVSKEQAAIALARAIAPSQPKEARQLLEPLRTERSAVSQAAITALSEVPHE